MEGIYYINLDRRVDRNKNVIEQLKKHNLHATRVTAVDGTKLNNISNAIVTKNGIERMNKKLFVSLTNGGIGCAMSHRNIWLDIQKTKKNNCLILEDDITINDNFSSKLNFYLNNVPDDYDILFLGYHPSSLKHVITNSQEYDYNNYNDSANIFIRSNRVYGLFGYIVSQKGVDKLLKLFPITNQIDTEISDAMKHLNVYLVKPNEQLIISKPSEINDDFGSDIQMIEKFESSNNFMIIAISIIFYILICFITYKILKIYKLY